MRVVVVALWRGIPPQLRLEGDCTLTPHASLLPIMRGCEALLEQVGGCRFARSSVESGHHSSQVGWSGSHECHQTQTSCFLRQTSVGCGLDAERLDAASPVSSLCLFWSLASAFPVGWRWQRAGGQPFEDAGWRQRDAAEKVEDFFLATCVWPQLPDQGPC